LTQVTAQHDSEPVVLTVGHSTRPLVLGNVLAGVGIADLVREGVLIGGWVAMWRPLEILLYAWWPIQRDARLYDRLGDMPVRIAAGNAAT
jgi:hypothetical protein